ncbi:DUF2259 domain-containing protein [Arvimicrobium flavum]|uniref:DUF2259 domain-containing protein n=1 Tax=Arvimicrobium flavum TaxID=3393320 RepID=UPI00237B0D55|nr:DUF2259 domain-containing protein [Mesorhizobium shangrilense]
MTRSLTRHAARAGRRALALALLLPALSLPLHAGDTAQLNILGFSEDGSIFAFEEYGIQDGSGFPYANRYYVDTGTDAFVKGTPIRVRLDDESASLGVARAKARESGEKIVAEKVLQANPGFTAAFNAVTEVNADPARIVAYPFPVFPPIAQALEFRLEEVPVAEDERCHGLGEMKGLRLLQIDPSAGGVTRIVHEDTTVPQSRGCAIGYRLAGLQTHAPDGSLGSYAVLIAVERVGFEGPDYRWMAVTGRP